MVPDSVSLPLSEPLPKVTSHPVIRKLLASERAVTPSLLSVPLLKLKVPVPKAVLLPARSVP